MMEIEMLNKTLLASSVAMALGLAPLAQAADNIIFDPDGAGGTNGNLLINNMAWAPSSAVSIAGGSVVPGGSPITRQLYAHGLLTSLGNPGGGVHFVNNLNNPTMPPGFQLTFVLGAPETISTTSASVAGNDPSVPDTVKALLPGADKSLSTVLSQTASFTDPTPADAAGFDNFFKIYYDAVNPPADGNAGTGFDDGQLILEGTVSIDTGDFISYVRACDNSGGACDPNLNTTPNVLGYDNLDQSGTDQWPSSDSVVGSGNTFLNIDVSFADSNFFKSDITNLSTGIIFDTSNNAPFTQTNPSASFSDGSGGTYVVKGANAPSTLPNTVGAVNGARIVDGGFNDLNQNGTFDGIGPDTFADFILQTQSKNTFNVAQSVPAPTSIALMGLGLAGLGFGAKRRKRKS